MEVQKVETWVPLTAEAVYDGQALSRGFRWHMEAGRDTRPLTKAELKSGWRTFTDSAGTTDRFAVAWRAEQQEAERRARAEAAIAACPYVACTCGYHED